MDIQSFLTLQAAPAAGQNITTGLTAGSPAMKPGQSFFDIILARFIEASAEHKENSEEKVLIPGQEQGQKKALESENPLFTKQPKLDPAKLIAETPEIEKQIEAFNMDVQSEIAATLTLNQNAFNTFLKPLDGEALTINKDEIKTQQQTFSLEKLLMIDGQQLETKPGMNRLHALLKKIQNLLGNDTQSKALLANYTPEQLANLKEKISALLQQAEHLAETQNPINLGPEEQKILAEISVLLIALVPPPAPPVYKAVAGEAVKAEIIDVNGKPQPLSADLMAAKLKNMIAAEAPAVEKLQAPEKIAHPNLPAESSRTDAKLAQDMDFEYTLKQFTGQKDSASLTPAEHQAAQKTPGVKPDLSALQNWLFPAAGAFTAPYDIPEGLYNELGLSTAPQVTNPAMLTHTATQAHAAAMPHPAVQIVASAIHKGLNGGEKTLIVQMDPPELGRVEVQLNFGKDKTVKAVLVSEKPETHMMLQRDAHILERILQEAGLDADGSSLSFTLADDNNAFSHNGGHDGSYGHARGQTDEGEELIESTMTWHVDPETGHMRYDILA